MQAQHWPPVPAWPQGQLAPDCKGMGEGAHCNSDANGPVATTTASYAAQPSCALWTSLDALTHACSATNANHVSDARHYNAWPAAPATGDAVQCDGGAPDWHESSTKAEQNCEGRQKGGKPFTGVPEPPPCRDEKGQQRVLTQPAHSGHCLGQSQRGTVGDGECETTTVVPMAGLPTAVSDQVERVHGTVPSCRASFPGSGHGITTDLKRAQRRLDLAKKRMDADDKDGTYTVSSDEETEEMDSREETDVAKDENAQKIQEGLHQVVKSLETLSESAEKLEPKAKRPRKADEEDGGEKPLPSMQPFGKAGAV